jgi:hypothetical protein
MQDTQEDLVIQISASETAPHAADRNADKTEEGELSMELRRRLQPGVEIALAFPGYMALTSILWISESEMDRGFRAGVRLLGVSALPAGISQEQAALSDGVPAITAPLVHRKCQSKHAVDRLNPQPA